MRSSTLGQFQSTHPRGVRRTPSVPDRGRAPVSIHAPAWGATPGTIKPVPGVTGFNPRTRVGCDCCVTPISAFLAKFQSTHPRGVRRLPWHPYWCSWPCFNPRTRVGCDLTVFDRVRIALEVSIHAPAWGATYTEFRQGFHLYVSIHAPAWGATRNPSCTSSRRSAFQSTHPRGVRPQNGIRWKVADAFQSTHPRGVRQGEGANLKIRNTGFNPRTRVGCDLTFRSVIQSPRSMFQSTHPRGVRPPLPRPSACRAKSFNPRTRVGCDPPRYSGRCKRASVSIHAPAWGATQFSLCGEILLSCFNPRTRVGCDEVAVQHLFDVDVVSIHAPAWGATRWACGHFRAKAWFQSTHPRGVRRGGQ